MAMNPIIKFNTAIASLKEGTEYVFHGPAPTTEELFNKVEWITGVASNGTSITTTTNPHSELNWTAVNNKMNELETAYTNAEYQRKRKVEYPSIADQLDKIYHEGIDKWKSDIVDPVKAKYPKPS